MATLQNDYQKAINDSMRNMLTGADLDMRPGRILMGTPKGTISSTHISPGNPLASQAQEWEKKLKEQSEKVEILELVVEKLITMNNDLRNDLDNSTKYLIEKLNPKVRINNDSVLTNIRPTDTPFSGRKYHDTP